MANRQKIIVMSKLALYDKTEGEADRDVFAHFRHDYIYRRNLGTRLSVGFGAAVIAAAYWLEKVMTLGLDVLMLDLPQNITDTILFIVAVLAVYTVIGTFQGTRQYYLAQKRLEKYYSLLRVIDRINERTEQRSRASQSEDDTEEGSANRHGTNTRRKRTDS